jgi:hypothetical protein
MADPTTLPNYEKIGGATYVCRTQAGFKQALRDFTGPEPAFDRTESHGYPKSYPSLVTLSWGYAGHDFVRAQCMHVNRVLDALDKHRRT